MCWRARTAGPAAADRDAARPGPDPEDPRAPGPLRIEAQPRARAARVLTRSSRAPAHAAVGAPLRITRTDPAGPPYSRCRLTRRVRRRSIPVTLRSGEGARGGRSCALCLRLQRGYSAAEVGGDGGRRAHAVGSAGGGR
jgi:hypothetical protein